MGYLQSKSFNFSLLHVFILTTICVFQIHESVAQGYVWANNAGGNNSDCGTGISKDAGGNLYVTGFFGSGTASFGGINLTGSGIQNLFVAKYDHLTGDCLWAVKADGFMYPTAIDVSSDGSIYVTGYLNGTNTFGTLNVTATGIYDVFVAKSDSSGIWQWATTAGGIGAGNQDYGNSIVADGTGNCYVTGTFGNTIHFGSTTFTSFGGDDIFVSKLNSSGVWQWSKQFGSASIDNGNGITADLSGNLFITGCFSGNVQFGSATLSSNGSTEDVYVCKMDTSGNPLWAIKAGGPTPDYGNAIQQDLSGNLYVTGWYSTTASFGSSNVTTSGGNEVFVARCNPNGSWQWVASGGTPGIDIGYDIAIDNDKNSYVIGYVNAGYPVIFGNDTINIVSDFSDVFVAKCDSNGLWQWLVVNGSTSWDVGYGIVTQNCSQFVTGYFSLAVNFDTIALTASGSTSDAFIGKYTHDAMACASLYTSDTTVCEKFCISFFDQSVNNPTSWLWLFPGGIPSSSNDQNPASICYNNPGTFDVTLITITASGNDTLLLQDYITVYPTPPIPIISQNGYTLTSTAAIGYQWQFNSIDISGATNQSYDAAQSGYYTVYISNENGCLSYATVYVLITGIEQGISDENVFIYPNPSGGKINIQLLSDEMREVIAVDVLNMQGQKVYSCHNKIASSHNRIQIDLTGVFSGIYFLEIRSENDFVRKKILIAR